MVGGLGERTRDPDSGVLPHVFMSRPQVGLETGERVRDFRGKLCNDEVRVCGRMLKRLARLERGWLVCSGIASFLLQKECTSSLERKGKGGR